MTGVGMVLDGRTAIVTGASSGLGVTFAEAPADAGANVVLAARRRTAWRRSRRASRAVERLST
jgi:NAD(P)-dependent dehydrogenase (short-subunit alcohol dehydrogenase family)